MSVLEGVREEARESENKECDKKGRVEERKQGVPILRCNVALPCHSDL